MAQGKVKPLRQGDIDGLCGVYACLNSILCRYPALNNYEKQCQLFASVVGPVYDLHQVLNGAEIDSVTKVLEKFKEELKDEVKIEFTKFSALCSSFSFAEWLKAIRFDKKTESLIVGFEGMDSHWTVINSFTKKYAYLFDSYTYKKFLIDQIVWAPCADKTKIIVNPSDIIRIKIKKK